MYLLNISEDIFQIICGVGLLQGFLLAALIFFHPRSDRTVNKFLAFYIACFSIIMCGPLFLKVVGWKNIAFVTPFPVLVGPLMYFYIKSFKETITWKKAWPHLILFLFFMVTSHLYVSWLSDKYPGTEDFPEEGLRSPFGLSFTIIRNLQLIIYYFLSRRELNFYQKSIRQLFSETSRINLNWVKWLINGYLLIIIASIVIFFLMTKFPERFYILYMLNIAIATPYIYITTYKGITQPTIWQNKQAGNKEKLEEEIHKAEEIVHHKQHNQKPGVNDNRVGEIAAKVVMLMEKEKFFQEPELTLQNLADKIQFPAHQVSLAINEGMKKSFYDLVNGYRVEEAKRLLLHAKSRDYTILSVGFEAGFNSKTTFNTVFKKFTGLTPTEYRDKQRQIIAAG